MVTGDSKHHAKIRGAVSNRDIFEGLHLEKSLHESSKILKILIRQ